MKRLFAIVFITLLIPMYIYSEEYYNNYSIGFFNENDFNNNYAKSMNTISGLSIKDCDTIKAISNECNWADISEEIIPTKRKDILSNPYEYISVINRIDNLYYRIIILRKSDNIIYSKIFYVDFDSNIFSDLFDDCWKVNTLR